MEIDITGVDLRKFVADVYDLSVPQGSGGEGIETAARAQRLN